MTVRAAQADKEKTKKRRCEPHGQMNEWRTMNEDKEKETSPYSHTELVQTSSLRNVATQKTLWDEND